MQKLQNYRKQDTDNGLTWWSDDSNNFKENDVEITSYILMALLDSNKPLDLLPILKWLIKQRNDKGGFHSTHDTVVGLQALVKFAQKMANLANVNVDIEYTATDEKGQEVKKGVLKVQQNNFLTAQTEKVKIDVLENLDLNFLLILFSCPFLLAMLALKCLVVVRLYYNFPIITNYWMVILYIPQIQLYQSGVKNTVLLILLTKRLPILL